MAAAAASPGRIFVSYRREDSAYPAGWLCDRLTEHLGPGQVFKDVDSIELGDDFVKAISTAVGSCDVLLAVIGAHWLTATDENGRRRLDDPDDFVRVEIEAGLKRDVRVIPILVDGARMPRAAELPPTLTRLVRRQALELSPNQFDYDTSRLLKVLDATLVEIKSGAPRPVPTRERDRGVVPARAEHRATGLDDNRTRWVLSGVLVAVVLLLLVLAGGVLTAVSASRPNQPPSDAWMFVLWMSPAAPLLASAWIVARNRKSLLGGAIGCVAIATLWVALSWAVIEWRDVIDPPRAALVVLLALLAATVVGLFVAVAAARAPVRLNAWSRAVPALVLVAVAFGLRTQSSSLGKLLAAPGDPGTLGWAVAPSRGMFWANVFVPLVVLVVAALMHGNHVQAQALRTFVYLLVAYDLVIHTASLGEAIATSTLSPQSAFGDAFYVIGTLCLAWAVRVGQP